MKNGYGSAVVNRLLKTSIKKNLYWEELFNKLDSITSRKKRYLKKYTMVFMYLNLNKDVKFMD